MDQTKWIYFIIFSIVLGQVIQLLIINPVIAQDPNTTSIENHNNTRVLVSVKNHTISFTSVDATTNETIDIKSFPIKPFANTTSNQNLTTNTGNATTNEILIPENTINESLTTNTGNATTNEILIPENTINESLTTNTGNATTNVNLTDKFNALQGK